MRLLLLVLTALVAMAVGAYVGSSGSNPGDAVERQNARASREDGEAAASAIAASSFAGENPRQVKLFSALKEPVQLRKRSLLFEAIRNLQPGDFKTVVDHVEKLPREISYELLELLMERWVQVDFKAVQDWLLASPTRVGRTDAWVKANPEAALQAAMTMTDRARADQIAPFAIAAMPGTPNEKLARLRQLSAGLSRDRVMSRLLHDWAATEPRAAFEAIDGYLSGALREETRSYMLRRWAEREPAAALEKLSSLLPALKVGALGNETVTAMIDRIPEGQRQVALDWVRDLSPELRSAAGIAVARKWAQKDPAAALAWCLENGIEPARGYRTDFGGWGAGVLGEAIANKPIETVAWLEQLAAGPERDRLFERALADSFWLLDKGEAFSKAESALLRLFAQLPEDAQIRNAHEFGERRAREGSLTDVRDWAERFPAGVARANAIAGAMSGAYERDASRVNQVMANLLSPADRDAALRGLASAMQDEAPADAASRAVAISDAATRRSSLDAVIRLWLRKDPTATREWLQNAANGIPQQWRETWLQKQ